MININDAVKYINTAGQVKEGTVINILVKMNNQDLVPMDKVFLDDIAIKDAQIAEIAEKKVELLDIIQELEVTQATLIQEKENLLLK